VSRESVLLLRLFFFFQQSKEKAGPRSSNNYSTSLNWFRDSILYRPPDYLRVTEDNCLSSGYWLTLRISVNSLSDETWPTVRIRRNRTYCYRNCYNKQQQCITKTVYREHVNFTIFIPPSVIYFRVVYFFLCICVKFICLIRRQIPRVIFYRSCYIDAFY